MVDISVGLVAIFVIVLMPVYIFYAFALASSLKHPRAIKVSVLMMGLPIALMLAAIALIWVLSALLSIIVP